MAAPGPPAAFAAMIGAIKAKDDPRYAGTCHFVMIRKAMVASPLEIKAIAGFNPTKYGTKMVAPNIANKCCKLNVSQWAGDGMSFISKMGLFIQISPLCFIKKPSLLLRRKEGARGQQKTDCFCWVPLCQPLWTAFKRTIYFSYILT
jgi:hypothetical protein